tara:strand:+ start:14359 stop:15432 length:1074 start_codon:yes stop_codon:yes gene_type:complete
MFTNTSYIKKLMLDHTSRCNLMCPQCGRVSKDQKVNPGMPITDLTLQDYKIILEPFTNNKLDQIIHCGNFGDIIASPTFEETFLYSLDFTRTMRIETNGSARKPKWWTDLANNGKEKLSVVFSIDGLKDTNHLYRIGSNFEKIIENATAYIKAGGKAEWQFIEFAHNYHQIDDAEKLASKLGFTNFTVKYTARFQDTKTQVKTRKGNTVKNKDSHVTQDFSSVLSQYKNFDDYVANTDITCKFKKDFRLFIDMDMRLWPCCWFGGPKYFADKRHTKQWESFKYFLDLYGEDFNDMRKYGWNVLQNEFFQTYLERSWNNPDDKYKRIYTCGRTCGQKFEYSSGYGKNWNTKELNYAKN